MVVFWCSMLMYASALVVAAFCVHGVVVALKARIQLWLWYPGQYTSCVLVLCVFTNKVHS